MAQNYSEEAALKLAKETVGRLEQQFGDPNKIRSELIKIQSTNSISKVPTADEIFKQRVAELSQAYAKVSDGKGGIDRSVSKNSRERFQNVLDGKYPDGRGYLTSQQLAIHTERTEQLADAIPKPLKRLENVAIEAGEGIAHKAGKFGLAGKAVGAVAGVAVTMAATSGTASASQLTEAGLNGVADGLGTLTVGEGSKRGRLCQVFGDVGVPLAAGAVGTALGTPLVGGVAATAASAALSQPATNACNNIAQRLGF